MSHQPPLSTSCSQARDPDVDTIRIPALARQRLVSAGFRFIVPHHEARMIGYEWGVEYLFWDLGLCTAGTCVEVELSGSEAFVRLMDADNYEAYRDDDECEYFGGVWEISPLSLDVPYDGHWYLVVDGYEGPIKVHRVTVTAD